MSTVKRHKLRARLWLCFIFCALTGAHYFFYRFSIHPLNPYAVTRGLTFGLVVWTAVLLVAMWLRHGWARYVASSVMVLAIFGFGFAVMMLNRQSANPIPDATQEVLGGLVLYVIALVPMAGSQSLRLFLAPRTASGR
jgi:hypothetical protein